MGEPGIACHDTEAEDTDRSYEMRQKAQAKVMAHDTNVHDRTCRLMRYDDPLAFVAYSAHASIRTF